ncbi:GNAT family N-acetyltransferase [Tabrizicola sp. BL-A-41-H6]|uniref:GNAT family N-acetyltransferase n=1 Tax=Tabrizicola sp. BL-A-41-H6 TaxID=3421107 RepID=UPI003D67B0BB
MFLTNPHPASFLQRRVPALLKPIVELESEAAGTAHVADFANARACRVRGLGSALLRSAQSSCRKRGMSLLVASGNDAAKGFYSRFGYQETARRLYLDAKFRVTGKDWVVKTKD